MAPNDEIHPNVAIVHRVYAALGRSDFAAVLDHLADDVELEIHGPVEIPFVGPWRGRKGAEEFFAVVGGLIERDDAPVVEDILAVGPKVIAYGQDRVRHKATGKVYDGWWVHVLELRDGRIARVREFFDTAAALEAFR